MSLQDVATRYGDRTTSTVVLLAQWNIFHASETLATSMQAALYALFSPSWVLSMSMLASEASEDDLSSRSVSPGDRRFAFRTGPVLQSSLLLDGLRGSPVSSPSSQQSSQPVMKSTMRNGYRP
ncbi:hypothetical protein BV25DRAFT_242992 [Artomyces pyxidatus]|uniref:Uncharacterized protein n=1 Tax=Artomyces pyxidatus TaxID=48021 RepID=A0ACB8T7H5_9AGAM|nr:hypothetical protein BV25DRAFT_242992 [Artomyces pyxidatus]